MVSYDWANGGLVGAFLRHGMVSGLRGESVLFLGMGMEFEEKLCWKVVGKCIVSVAPLQEFYCWVDDVLGERHLTRLSGLMGSKAGSHTDDL